MFCILAYTQTIALANAITSKVYCRMKPEGFGIVNDTLLQPVAVSKVPRYREAAYIAIKEAILAGQLGPNQPLTEEQIAASLNISRTPVREALAILEHEG